MENGFGATAPYTVGVEEEFQLVDPGSRGLTPAVDEVLAAGKGSRLITSELSRSCVEMLSPVYASAADLARELPGLRREVRDLARSCGVEIVAAGAHPFSEPTKQPLTGGDHSPRLDADQDLRDVPPLRRAANLPELGGLRGPYRGPCRLGEHPRLLLVLVGCASAPEVRYRGVARARRTDGRILHGSPRRARPVPRSESRYGRAASGGRSVQRGEQVARRALRDGR